MRLTWVDGRLVRFGFDTGGLVWGMVFAYGVCVWIIAFRT